MEKQTKRIYPATQLVCSLNPIVLKTYLYLLGWQGQGTIKLYVKQIAKACKLTETEVEVSIQTLEDIKLIDICKIDQTYCATLNAEQAQKYYNVPMSKIMESDGIKLAEKVTWNVEEKNNEFELASISDADLEKMIKELQRRREEKKNKVLPSGYTEDELLSQLPF